MTETIIFGGTAEGRLLSEWAADFGIGVLVCTATAYGRELVPERARLSVRDGRLDAEGMRALFLAEQPELVVDATHPHAALVTRTIREALSGLKIPYLRVHREEADLSGVRQERVYRVGSVREAAGLLAQDGRNVLLATGTKELPEFAAVPGLLPRLFVRVLPTVKALEECAALGLSGRQVIAMQGPFSAGLNAELLRSTDAGWLVTKESGARGGFAEKLAAAAQTGAKVLVIRRPPDGPGVSLEEAKRLLAERFPGRGVRRLSLIGMGMGGGGQLTREALAALRQSDLVLGAGRMLADTAAETPDAHTEERYLGRDILEYLNTHPQYVRIAVLYSGDTGFHSGAASLLKELSGKTLPYETRVFPGISSLSALCARFQTGWEGVYAASAHGADCDAAALLEAHGRIFLLLDREHTAASVCRALTAAGHGGARVSVGVRLGYEDEKLYSGRADSLTELPADGLAALLAEKENAREAAEAGAPAPGDDAAETGGNA